MDEAEHRRNWYIGLIIFYLIATSLTVIWVHEYWENSSNYISLQLIGILLGSGLVVGFLVARIRNWPLITKKNAETYLTASITVIVAIFGIIGLTFTILYGSLYSNASFLPYTVNLTNITMTEINSYVKTLVKEGIAVVLITVYAFAVITASFIYPVTKKLEESQSEVINKSPPVSNDEAQNILRTRYAKGEITKKQFEQMKKDLND